MSNANTPFLIKLNVDLIIGAIIRKAGDAAAQAAKAQEVIDVGNALKQINSGDTASGLAALDAAIQKNVSADPAQAAATQTAIAWLATKASAIQNIGSGTLLSALNTDILNSVIDEAVSVAGKYIPAKAA